MPTQIQHNLSLVEEKLKAACKEAGQKRSAVTLVAISKTFPVELIFDAIECEQLEFGENYIPEGSKKAELVKSKHPEARFHFVGHLQRNKVKAAVSNFDLIQTVDRKEVAEEIDKQARNTGKIMPVLLQVNISGEEAKSGCKVETLQTLAESTCKLANLSLKGIMSIGSALELDLSEDKSISVITAEFEEMRDLKGELENSLGINLPELSMGMSGDFELALRHGATLIRVGTSIFGNRAA